MRKVFILGLDSTPPRILYEEYGVELENLKNIVGESLRFTLKSCHPPITIPAWAVMFTGKTPGELGIYGFRHRLPGDVRESYIVNSRHIKRELLWEDLSKRGFKVGILGVPPTYPPKPVNGFLISDFTTPSPDKTYTFPPWLGRIINSMFGPYIFDVTYRSSEKDRVLKEIFKMTEQHLKIVEYLVKSREWDFFTYVEIGVDRVQHAFWKYFDENHPRHVHHEVYSNAIPEYYKLIDGWVGKLQEEHLKNTVLVVVSDHGAKPMKGAFAVNQWLIEEGYLKLKREVSKPGEDLSEDLIDWGKTVAWGWGGYYSRIFINLEGREPRGTVNRSDYESLVERLKKELASIRGPRGEFWETRVYTPRELYSEVRGDPPDLLVYFDDLSWRAAGTLGWDTMYLPENDRGPDDAVHDWYGVFSIYDPEGTLGKGYRGIISIEEVYRLLKGVILG